MVENHTHESGHTPSREKIRPPTWAPPLLGFALPVAVVLELIALAAAGLVFPLFDLLPVFVLVVAFVSRRWAGVSAKWFKVSAILAGIMLIEWIAWDSWYIYAVVNESVSVYRFDEIVRQFGNSLTVLLAVEIIALLFFFGLASVTSYEGVKRNMRQAVALDGPEDPADSKVPAG